MDINISGHCGEGYLQATDRPCLIHMMNISFPLNAGAGAGSSGLKYPNIIINKSRDTKHGWRYNIPPQNPYLSQYLILNSSPPLKNGGDLPIVELIISAVGLQGGASPPSSSGPCPSCPPGRGWSSSSASLGQRVASEGRIQLICLGPVPPQF